MTIHIWHCRKTLFWSHTSHRGDNFISFKILYSVSWSRKDVGLLLIKKFYNLMDIIKVSPLMPNRVESSKGLCHQHYPIKELLETRKSSMSNQNVILHSSMTFSNFLIVYCTGQSFSQHQKIRQILRRKYFWIKKYLASFELS